MQLVWLECAATEVPNSKAAETAFVIARTPEGWHTKAFDESGDFDHLEGLAYIARLAEQPERSIPNRILLAGAGDAQLNALECLSEMTGHTFQPELDDGACPWTS